MTLRKKTLLVSGAVICCLTMILLIATNTILLKGFTALEEKDMGKNLTRAQNSLAVEQMALEAMVSDWAFWDDTYEFINDHNEDYIHKNLNDVTFITQNLNFVMYIDEQEEMVYGQGFDLEKKINSSLPVGLLDQLLTQKVVTRNSQEEQGVSGIVILPDGAAMIAVRPILDTDKKKTARGMMVVGRYLTSGKIAELADTMQLSLASHLFNEEDLPTDFRQAKSAFLMNKPVVITPLGEENIAGYVVLQDIYHNSAMILRVDTERYIYLQGKKTLACVTVILIMVGILFGTLHLLLLEKTVLSRLTSLSQQVMKIGKEGNPAVLLEECGNDELGNLAHNMNQMLTSLTLTQNELRTSEAITRVLLDGIPDSLLRIDKQGMILDFQTGRSRLMATSPQMIVGRNISECYPSHVVKIFMWKIQVAINSNTQQIFEYEVFDEQNPSNLYQEIRIDGIGENEVIAIIRDFEKII